MDIVFAAAVLAVGFLGAAVLFGRMRAANGAGALVALPTKHAPGESQLIKRREDIARTEARLQTREETLDVTRAEVARREQRLAEREAELDHERELLTANRQERERELERLSGMTASQAKQALLKEVEDQARHDAARRLREIEEQTKREADRRVRNILSVCMQRLAAAHAAETTVSVVQLSSDDMKGRIIGREGRNIRALQQATGIDLIIDDTPEAVIISGFDPVRREVARTALNKLIVDGRIHPARIEEVVAKARQEVNQRVKDEGEGAVLELGFQGLHPEIVRHLGILRFRTSYGQQVLNHSKEVAHLAAMMAAEIGADVRIAKLSGLLHDIGKAIDHEVEGSHAVIGADLLQRHGVQAPVVHAVRAHHYDEEPHTVEAFLLIAADAISAARPGARRETLEAYIKRLEKLEEIANSFQGVQQSYAIQAGREVRILVRPDQIDDASAQLMARDIAKRIESEMSYPGQIRVTVVRETRAVEYAK